MDTSILHTEKELLYLVADGNEQAFRSLVRDYSPLLHTFLLKHNATPEMAEEVVQDVFMQIWLTRETLTEVRNFHGYLFVISRNRVFDELKKEARTRRRFETWQREEGEQPGEETDAKDREKHLTLVEEAIERLAPQQKKVWMLSRREGLTYLQIAEKLNLSRETVKSHIQAANVSVVRHLAGKIDLIILWMLLR